MSDTALIKGHLESDEDFSYWMYELTTSVLNGSVPVTRLDDMVTRILVSEKIHHSTAPYLT